MNQQRPSHRLAGVPRGTPPALADEPFWPVAIALTVLGVSTASLIAVVIGFDNGRWHSSGWYWLGLLASVLGALWLLALSTRARVRRRVQMGLIVSVMLHFALAVFLKDQFLSFVVKSREKQIAEVEPMPTLPDYYLPPINTPAPAQAFERPVETEPVESPRQQAARQLEAAEFSPARPSTSLNREQTQISPESFERQQQAVPRRADNLSQLSRQDSPSARIQTGTIRAPRQRLDDQPPQRASVAAIQARRASRTAPVVNRRSLSSPHARRTDTEAIARPERRSSPDTLTQELPDNGRPERRDPVAQIPWASASDIAVSTPPQEPALPDAAAAATPLARRRTAAPRSSSTRISSSQLPHPSSFADADAHPNRQRLSLHPTVDTQQHMTVARDRQNLAALAETTAREPSGRGDVGDEGRSAAASGEAGTGSAQAPAGTRLARRSTAGPTARQAVRSDQRQPDVSTTARIGVNRAITDGDARARVSTGDFPSDAAESGSGVARQSPVAELGIESTAAPAVAAEDGARSDRGGGETPGDIAAYTPTPGRLDRTPSRVPVRVAADLGMGGLSSRRAASPGIASRRANPSSPSISLSPSRFLPRVSSAPTVNSRARDIAPSFAGRVARRRNPSRQDDGQPSAVVEETIERGLAYLSTVQLEDGRWSLQRSVIQGAERPDRDPTIVADTAATGLALLAFLGAGYDHYEGPYRDQIARAIQFLIEHQSANGDLFMQQRGPANEGVWLYSHGIAAIALCEAFGMTGDLKLKPSAQRALDFIVAAQEPERGGWRYAPGVMADLSVSGWQLMALRSGQLAGLNVPSSAVEKTVKLLNATQRSPKDASQYVYNPWGPDTEPGRFGPRANTVMTSVGLLMRLYTGWRRGHPALQLGAFQLADRLPEMRRPANFAGTENPFRDTYYWYNATQVMFHMQGELWSRWQSRLYPLLAETQVESGPMAGSWDPLKPVPDRWGRYAGRIYVTTMNLLSLEVYHRHLPLYSEDLAAAP